MIIKKWLFEYIIEQNIYFVKMIYEIFFSKKKFDV